jgi:hypothetical protein
MLRIETQTNQIHVLNRSQLCINKDNTRETSIVYRKKSYKIEIIRAENSFKR